MTTFWIILVIAIFVALVAYKVYQQISESKDAELAGFGFSVRKSQVFWHNQPLGALAGSEASVTDGTSRHTLTRVVTVVGALTKKTNASLLVAFPNGTVREVDLKGAALVRQAQSFAVRYNALASAAGRQRETPRLLANPLASDTQKVLSLIGRGGSTPVIS
jgi:hypothetical protein